jgi:flagellar biosynthesis protein FlhF
MPLETFVGTDSTRLLATAVATLGEDAVVLGLRRAGRGFELTAADPATAAKLEPRAWGRPLTPSPNHPDLPLARFHLIAMVGPTGAGKTTTIAKLLGRASEVGKHCGVLALDTHRPGALAQTREIARFCKARHAVAYDDDDLTAALRALRRCRTVLVDTAGRGPLRADDQRATWTMLRSLRPAEIHLVVPAGLSMSRSSAILTEYRGRGVTHLLVTRLDECPEETIWFELAAERRLPIRWVADGQDLGADLRRSGEWVVGGLGTEAVEPASVTHEEVRAWA